MVSIPEFKPVWIDRGTRVNVRPRLAGLHFCQVPRHPTTQDRDYGARSRAPGFTARFYPSAGGLMRIEENRLDGK